VDYHLLQNEQKALRIIKIKREKKCSESSQKEFMGEIFVEKMENNFMLDLSPLTSMFG
jgi:hypothetical protein